MTNLSKSDKKRIKCISEDLCSDKYTEGVYNIDGYIFNKKIEKEVCDGWFYKTKHFVEFIGLLNNNG